MPQFSHKMLIKSIILRHQIKACLKKQFESVYERQFEKEH